jgi:hypothetical protein
MKKILLSTSTALVIMMSPLSMTDAHAAKKPTLQQMTQLCGDIDTVEAGVDIVKAIIKKLPAFIKKNSIVKKIIAQIDKSDKTANDMREVCEVLQFLTPDDE